MSQVWYVAYGSNLGADRFRCYLVGGRPEGGRRSYTGCRNPSEPEESFSLELPGALVFAGESGVWGGGMAFFDPTGAGSVACRAYLVTAEQFADVAAQEMRLEPGGEFAQAVADVLYDITALHRLGPGRYETVACVGDRDGVPLLTITNGDVPALPPTPPSSAYLRAIATGLRESHGWDDDRIEAYLASVATPGRGSAGPPPRPAAPRRTGGGWRP